MTGIVSRLVDAGMSTPAAEAKAKIFARARQALGLGEDEADAFATFVPGRIEVLGKHTDYAGGRSLLCAAERGICLAARRRRDRVVHVRDVVSGTRAVTRLDPTPASFSPVIAGSPLAGADWGNYVTTVARRLARNFPGAGHGADIAFGSDLPMAAGMSSSSALVTAMLLALAETNDLPASDAWRANITGREDLAEYLGSVENGQDFRTLSGDAGVGTFGGSEDHTAMLCCRAGELSQYRFCPVRHERQIALSPDVIFTVAVSGVVAEKTRTARAAYNRAALAAREVLARWNRATGRDDVSIGAAVESSPEAVGRIRRLLGGPSAPAGEETDLRGRFDQFVEETLTIIPRVTDRLAAGDVETIGDLVARSQDAAERGLRNQVPETSFLARSARDLGAFAASAFGAGFGGSVWALVPTRDGEDFCDRWRARYAVAFPQRAGASQFFTTPAGPAAMTIAAENAPSV